MPHLGRHHRRLWRALIGCAVAFAVAAQSLLIVFGGFGDAALADQATPAFAICHHDDSEAPAAPAGVPGNQACSHCIFCFAGSQHLVLGSPPAVSHRIRIAVAVIAPSGDERSLTRRPGYAIANPRGPPSGV